MNFNITDLRRKGFGVYRTTDEVANAHVILIESRKGKDRFLYGGVTGNMTKPTLKKSGFWMRTGFFWYSRYADESQGLSTLLDSRSLQLININERSHSNRFF
jgi:hypothetical protein